MTDRAQPIGAGAIEGKELLMLAIMRKFEEPALAQYDACLPDFATDEKRAFISRLRAVVPSNDLVASSPLATPLDELLGVTASEEQRSVLILQGIILERVREAIYRTASGSQKISAPVRALCAEGGYASRWITTKAPELIRARIGEGDELYDYFIKRSRRTLRLLDELGEPVDDEFGDCMDLWFSQIMGEFASDLLPICADELKMSRKKVIVHLTGSLMGLS